MPDTSSGQLAFVKEIVPGATPATPAFKLIDIVDEDLALGTTQIRSAAVNPLRVVKASRRAGKEVGGGLRFELTKATEIDTIIAAVLGNPFGGAPLTAKAGGAVVDTFTFERKISATDYRRFTGVRLGTAEFTIAPEQFIVVRVAGVGFSMTTGAAAIAGATYAAAGAAEKLTALDIASITLSGGIALALDYESIAFSVNNQLAARKRIGPNSVRSVGAGQALVTGTMRCFVDKAVADAFLGETAFNMDIPFVNAAEGYTALFKNVKITEYNDPITGNTDEFVSTVAFEATLDVGFGSSFGISKTS